MKFYILGYQKDGEGKRFEPFTSDTKRREAFNKLKRQGVEKIWVEPETVNWSLNSVGLEEAFKYAESAHLELGPDDDNIS